MNATLSAKCIPIYHFSSSGFFLFYLLCANFVLPPTYIFSKFGASDKIDNLFPLKKKTHLFSFFYFRQSDEFYRLVIIYSRASPFLIANFISIMFIYFLRPPCECIIIFRFYISTIFLLSLGYASV